MTPFIPRIPASAPAVEQETVRRNNLEEKDVQAANTVQGQAKSPLTPQQVRQHEVAFDVSRKFAPGDARLQIRLIEAVDYAFLLDAGDRENMELTGATDEEFLATKLGLRDGTIKLDTSWIE